MAIPRKKLQAVIDAGHPDDALIGLPVSLVREILSALAGPPRVHHEIHVSASPYPSQARAR